VPGRALGASANHQPDRKHLRHSTFENESHQGARLTSGWRGHGLQPHRSRTNTLARVNTPDRVALVRTGAVFQKGKLLERPVDITPTEPVQDQPKRRSPETTRSTGTTISPSVTTPPPRPCFFRKVSRCDRRTRGIGRIYVNSPQSAHADARSQAESPDSDVQAEGGRA
jgi:hypothetical protein